MSYKLEVIEPVQQQLHDKKKIYREIDQKVKQIEYRIKNLNMMETNQFNKFMNNKQKIKRKVDINNKKIQHDELKTLNKIRKIQKYQQDYQKAQNQRIKLKQSIFENKILVNQFKKQQAKKIGLEKQYLQLKLSGNTEDVKQEKSIRAKIIKDGNIQTQEKIQDFWSKRLEYFKIQKIDQINKFDKQQKIKANKFNLLYKQKDNISDQLEKIKVKQQNSKYYLNQSQGIRFFKQNFDNDKLAYSFSSINQL